LVAIDKFEGKLLQFGVFCLLLLFLLLDLAKIVLDDHMAVILLPDFDLESGVDAMVGEE